MQNLQGGPAGRKCREELLFLFKSKALVGRIPSSLRKVISLCPSRSSADWMKAVHIMEHSLLYWSTICFTESPVM